MSFPCKAEHLKPGYRVHLGHLESARLIKGISSWMVVHLVYSDLETQLVHIRLTPPTGGRGLLVRTIPNQYFRAEKPESFRQEHKEN